MRNISLHTVAVRKGAACLRIKFALISITYDPWVAPCTVWKSWNCIHPAIFPEPEPELDQHRTLCHENAPHYRPHFALIPAVINYLMEKNVANLH